MLIEKDMELYKKNDKRGVYFLWKMFIFTLMEEKKLLNKIINNMPIYKWGRGVYFLWK
jgi:hypothetical protein